MQELHAFCLPPSFLLSLYPVPPHFFHPGTPLNFTALVDSIVL